MLEKDLQIDVSRDWRKAVVKITHVPTGMWVNGQHDSSVDAARMIAMRKLIPRLTAAGVELFADRD